MISIIVPKPSASQLIKRGEIDNQLSGSYIVTAITHEFNLNEYAISVEIKKDSTMLNLDGPINFKDAVQDEAK